MSFFTDIVGSELSMLEDTSKADEGDLCSSSDIDMPSEFEFLLSLVTGSKPISSGNIYLNLSNDLKAYFKYVSNAFDAKGRENLGDAKENVVRIYGEDGFSMIMDSMSQAKKELLDKYMVLAISFELYAVAGEVIIHMKNSFEQKERKYHLILQSVRNNIKCILHALGNMQFKKEGEIGYEHVTNSRYRNFGITTKSPTALFVSENDRTEAILLSGDMDGCSLFHIEDSKACSYTYDLNGIKMDIVELREVIKELVKD